MQHILFVINSFSTGGISSSLKSILNSRLNEEFQFSVFSLTDTGDYLHDFDDWIIRGNYWTTASRINRGSTRGINKWITQFVRFVIRFIEILGGNLREIIDKKAIRKIEENHNFDKVVAFSEGEPTRFVAKFMNPHKIAWVHCDYSRCVKDAYAELKIYEKYEMIVSVSKYTKLSFDAIFPQLQERSTYIYNLLDVATIKKLSLEKYDDIDFIGNKFKIISVGRISEVKRFSYIPKIARKLKEKAVSFHWFIIGPKAEVTAYQELLDNITKDNVSDVVTLLGAKKNPYPYFREANLYVSLSWSEACPMVFNEAKVLNLPIVTTDFATAYEFIVEKVNGYIRPLDTIHEVILQFISGKLTCKGHDMEYDHNNEKILRDITHLFAIN